MEKHIEKTWLTNLTEDGNNRRMKPCIDNLLPSNTHTSDFEASRICHTISQANEKIHLASVVAESCYEDMVAVCSKETQDFLRQHVILAQETAKGYLDNNVLQRVYRRLDLRFKESLREALNLVTNSTTVSPNSTSEPKSKNLHIMVTYIDELFKITIDKLLTSQNDEKRRLEYLNDVIERSKKSHALIIALQKQLDEAENGKNEALTSLDAHIKRLVAATMKHENVAKEEHDRLWSKASRGITSIGDAHRSTTSELRRYFHFIQKTFDEDRYKASEKEKQLRKNCYKIETEVCNWIAKYDKNMNKLQKEIDEVVELQTLHRPALVKLEDSFAILKAKYKEIMEERIRKQEKIDNEIATLRARILAAVKIQALWRGHKVRKLQRKLKAKKKRKEKKDRKKKKKY